MSRSAAECSTAEKRRPDKLGRPMAERRVWRMTKGIKTHTAAAATLSCHTESGRTAYRP